MDDLIMTKADEAITEKNLDMLLEYAEESGKTVTAWCYDGWRQNDEISLKTARRYGWPQAMKETVEELKLYYF